MKYRYQKVRHLDIFQTFLHFQKRRHISRHENENMMFKWKPQNRFFPSNIGFFASYCTIYRASGERM